MPRTSPDSAPVDYARAVPVLQRLPAVRDAAFMVFAALLVVATYLGTRDPTGTAGFAVVATATAAIMHARLAMVRWRSAAIVLVCAAAVAAAGAAPRLAATVAASGAAGWYLIAPCTRRSDVLLAGAWTGVVSGAAGLVGLVTATPLSTSAAARDVLGVMAGGFVGAPIMLTAGPIVEWLFGQTSRLTLSEWLSYDHPLLRQLTLRAPGTFQHSVNVGVLSDAAAAAIGGDSLLARVGGLFHDVGKVKAPGYFIENQHGPNPHDALEPAASAAILRAHVLDGVALVREHRMGERIADFVREHHGTGTMRLLLDKAIEQGDEDADEATYQYPGPKPRSPETAIVMIADQLEATARSAPPPDAAACDRMVAQTVQRIREGEELDEARLQPGDLEAIQPAFSRALQAMYHRRLSYPSAGSERRPGRLPFLPRLARRRG